ncbi:MAG: HAD hydrolase family protein [Hydrotalea sp.]|jgi:3-deoxy-D-manno-octulosonate 8-phosphate phosphatase (KDO 8-P phosphatase)|nr:HAD hydrolase family protein [Hydrotalea sp.]
MSNLLQKLTAIKAFLFDMDGVLTDGSVYLLPNGIVARAMNTKDGYALQRATSSGLIIAIISGGDSSEAIERFSKLGITEIHMKVHDKMKVMNEIMERHQLQPHEILAMGDDIPDIPIMKAAGVSASPQDAVLEVREISAYISPQGGGKGCVRDVIEKVMKCKGLWDQHVFTTST